MCEWQLCKDEQAPPVRERSWDFGLICGNLPQLNSSTNPHQLPDKRQRYSDKHMKHIFFSILTVLAFSNCQTPAPSAKNILSCYVRYDAPGRKIKAEASLKDGTSKQIIEMPGGLRFQNTEMKILPVQGITYSLEYPAGYTPDVLFDWKLKKGVIGQVKLDLPVIDSFFFDAKTLSIQNPVNLKWLGKPLGKGETLVFIWENEAEGKSVPMEVSTTLGAPLIEVPAAKIAELGVGDWSLYLVRKRLAKSEVPDFVVESATEYYTKPIKVKIGK